MSTRSLTRGQTIVLSAAAVAMVAVGSFGAWGTYTNTVTEFNRAATAAGVVAAGEGLTLILALTMLGLTLLGQAAPLWVRGGLWLAPVSASGVGLTIASSPREAAVYAVTPLAMSGAAEGLGLIARRIVIYRTGVDAEQQRRNADAVQQLAYHRALSEGHPDKQVREAALRQSWKLAKHVGVGDHVLGAALVGVQRERITGGADAALAGMYAPAAAAAIEEPPARPRPATATEALREHFAGMDPADAIRLAHDARPDAPPAELAHLLGAYDIHVDVVAVALVLGQKHPEYEVERDDADDAPQVNALPRGAKTAAIREAASSLGNDARAADIVREVADRHRITVDEAYVRTVLSRKPKAKRDPGNGGYA
ncbi:hypothetical protein ACH4ND_01420 [Streptomyces sp. NPDC017179]|uniref:hypothetical protein n=1 Tax=Streptomyces sp. NPDC017179 TaxID=3364979 RepID=UPI00378B9E8D